MEILRQAMKNAAANYSQSTSIVKTAKVYDSCIDTAAIEHRGISPLANLITQYGGWSVTGSGLNSWTVKEKMGKVLRDLNVQTLLSVSVVTDPMDSSQHILSISYSSLGMGISYYYDESSQGQQIRQAYKTYMKTVARLLGGGSRSDYKMMNIYNFESSIARGVQSKSVSRDMLESLRDIDGQRSGRSLDSVDKTIYDFCIDSNFDISFMLDFLNTAFSKQNITFRSDEKVYYPHSTVYLTLFQKIAYQYKYISSSTIKDYIMWRVVDAYVMSMPDKFVQAKLKYLEAVAGVQEYKRWNYCLESMMSPMGMTLGRLYVDANFDETTKTTVKDMTSRLRQSFVDNLKSADWMDYQTKRSAKAKALAIKEDVGYPSYIKDNSELDAHYSTLDETLYYFENSIAMNRMVVQKSFGMLRQPVNKDMWAESPAQINGYYSPQQNRIVFLAGILQSPFYRKTYPKYLNYGSLAMVIGHEITHGFDSQGRNFDKNGNFKDWWSTYSKNNFITRAYCLVQQYNGYEVFGKNIDGIQTLNENIADNGGIKLAYEAYQSWVKDNKKEGRLPDLGFSVDQLFFIGFATPWCSVYKKQSALHQLEVDPHSYPKYRVLGPLSNFKKFAEAFSCRSGSKMNPYKKCSVW
ncbi:hypothetical protein OS493_011270 [Desmophyllum pertusum]|uniref:Uncharacterized protein n=1 Tax=Desmophyllum pertusum TaxID=174260 RepID=A0A9X0CSB0_9CNID|nr:hypothetical protein OS493_011270 [Desmophyllum pertusum]